MSGRVSLLALRGASNLASVGTTTNMPIEPDLLASATEGATVYLGAMDDTDGMATRVEEAGGQIIMPPTDMGEMLGFMRFFIDSVGNRIGIQQPGAGKQ